MFSAEHAVFTGLRLQNLFLLTWREAALLEDGCGNEDGLLGVGQELVGVPPGLRVPCVGINIAQLAVG